MQGLNSATQSEGLSRREACEIFLALGLAICWGSWLKRRLRCRAIGCGRGSPENRHGEVGGSALQTSEAVVGLHHTCPKRQLVEAEAHTWNSIPQRPRLLPRRFGSVQPCAALKSPVGAKKRPAGASRSP